MSTIRSDQNALYFVVQRSWIAWIGMGLKKSRRVRPSFLEEDELDLLQHAQVLHHGDAADVEVRGERTNAHPRPLHQEIQHAPPARVGERGEEMIGLSRLHW